jgi:hypothetical protein
VTRSDLRTLSWIERTIKTTIKEEKLPEIPEVIEFKKKRLLDNIKEFISGEAELHYVDLAKDLLELDYKPEEILAAVLQE